jgi:hypothetical protein
MQMPIDLSWLIGHTLMGVEKKDHSWFFLFDDGVNLATESFWRLVGDRVIVTSEDHNQKFGLPAPVDAASVILEKIGKSHLERPVIDARTGDFFLSFDNGHTLQFLTDSGGYEGWRLGHPGKLIICLGGGELAIFNDPKQNTQTSP